MFREGGDQIKINLKSPTGQPELEDLAILHNHLRDFPKPEKQAPVETGDLPIHDETLASEGSPIVMQEHVPGEATATRIVIGGEDREKPFNALEEEKQQKNFNDSLTPEGIKFFGKMRALEDLQKKIALLGPGQEKDEFCNTFDRLAGFDTGIKKTGTVRINTVRAILMGEVSGPIYQGENGVIHFDAPTVPTEAEDVDAAEEFLGVSSEKLKDGQKKEKSGFAAKLERLTNKGNNDTGRIDQINEREEQAKKDRQAIIDQENKRWQEEQSKKAEKLHADENLYSKEGEQEAIAGEYDKLTKEGVIPNDFLADRINRKSDDYKAEKNKAGQDVLSAEDNKETIDHYEHEGIGIMDGEDLMELKNTIAESGSRVTEIRDEENEIIDQGIAALRVKEAEKQAEVARLEAEVRELEKNLSEEDLIDKINRKGENYEEEKQKAVEDVAWQKEQDKIISEDKAAKKEEMDGVRRRERLRAEKLKVRKKELKDLYLGKVKIGEPAMKRYVEVNNRLDLMRSVLPQIKNAASDEERAEYIKRFNEIAGYDTGIADNWKTFSFSELKEDRSKLKKLDLLPLLPQIKNAASDEERAEYIKRFNEIAGYDTGIAANWQTFSLKDLSWGKTEIDKLKLKIGLHKEVPGGNKIIKREEPEETAEASAEEEPQLQIYNPKAEVREFANSLEVKAVSDPEHKQLLKDLGQGRLERTWALKHIGLTEAKTLLEHLTDNWLDLQNAKDISQEALEAFLKVYNMGFGKKIILTGLETINGEKKLDDGILKLLSALPLGRIFWPDNIKKQIDNYGEGTILFEKSSGYVEEVADDEGEEFKLMA